MTSFLHVLLLPVMCVFGTQALSMQTGCPHANDPNQYNVRENLTIGTEIIQFNSIKNITLNGTYLGVKKEGEKYAVTVRKPFDYEALQSKLISVPFVCVPSNGSPVKGALSIIVTNVIESRPDFGHTGNAHFNVPENSPNGTEVGQLSVTVAEDDSSIIVLFTLNNTGTPFKIAWPPNNTPNRYIHGVISVQDPEQLLDYEKTPQYILTVKATIRGTNMTSTTKVYISVTDIDDEPPRFRQRNGYATSIPEKMYTRYKVISLVAEDTDTGHSKSHNIHYSLIRAFPDTSLFQVVNTTGEVFVGGNVDRETCDNYLLLVKAYQVDKPDLRMDITTINVTVSDVDDNPPVMNQTNYEVQIPENTPTDVIILTFIATDADKGRNAEMKYMIKNQGNHHAFKIDPISGVLRVNNSSYLDRETYPKWTFRVFAASAHNSSIRSEEANVTIRLLDENDNSPVFTSPLYIFTVNKNINKSSHIGEVHANDSDESNNGDVVYHLEGNESHRFNISRTGSIHAMLALDSSYQPWYRFTVTASDSAAPGFRRQTSVQVAVQVKDININWPHFINMTTSISVQEDIDKGSELLILQAYDEDPTDDLTFMLHNVSDFILQDVDTRKSKILLNKALDRETRPGGYNLTVTVTDSVHTSTATLSVSIEDVNDNAPVFHPSTYSFTVDEGVQNIVIGNVKATDKDINNNGLLHYSLVPPWDGNFNITQTGKINVASKLDRESLNATSGQIFLLVLVEDKGSPSLMATATATIQVKDVNDHVPRFREIQESITINEGQTISLHIQAYDEDEGENSDIHYSIGHTNVSSSSLEIQNATLRSTTSLAYGVYEVEVIAYNTVPYKPPTLKNDTLTVYIHVKDINNRPPIFNLTSYRFSLKEDFEVGRLVNRSICEIYAEDKDETPEYNTVTYSIVDKKGYFLIDPHNASLRLIKPLDFENTNQINFKVMATDGDPNHRENVNVTVNILNVNDNAPKFSSDIYHCSVEENSRAGLDCSVPINATDNDTSADRLTFSIDGYMKDKFTINSKTREIRPISSLDADAGPSVYVIQIKVVDNSVPEYTGSAVVEVTVKDKNDNSPVIHGPRHITVPENLPINTTVGTIFATDMDINDNLTFSLSTVGLSPTQRKRLDLQTRGVNNKSNAVFILRSSQIKNPASVEIVLNKELDRETYPDFYNLTVTVTDSVNTSPLTLSVSIEDVNDNAPVFHPTTYTFTVEEEVSPMVIGNVTATDEDLNENGRLQYTVFSPWGSVFNVTNTGQVEIRTTLDREKLTKSDRILLLIMATDEGTPALMTTATVTVTVQDVNDHAPQFKDTSDNVVTISKGQIFSFKLQAYDEDEGENSDIHYSIGHTNISSSSLEIQNATLRSTTSLAYGVYEVEVIAYNTVPYKPPTLKNDTLTVYIHVKDVNDHFPRFDNASYTFSLPEDFEVGQLVNESNIHAQDADQTLEYNTVTYSITNGDNYFEIDPYTATLRLIKPLHYEIEPVIHFQVTASDGDSTHQVSVNVSVAVTDVNNHAPVFTSALYNCTVDENVTSPIICQSSVNATDDDSGDIGTIRYSLQGQMKDIFTINNISGVISPRSALDYDTGVRSYVLSILATDHGKPERTGSAVVEISVKDINDNPPVIHGPSQFTVPENSPVNTILGAIFATDADVNDNLVFSVSDTANFLIQTDTNVLLTGKKFDYEKTTDRLLHVNVTVSDGKHNIECCIAVTVTNVNDEVPVFVNSSLTPTISEDMDSPSFYIQATDADADSSLSYSISPQVPNIHIGTSGLVTIEGPVSSRNNNTITFNVNVNDGKHRVSATAIVYVIDVNDNAPRFENSTYTFKVAEEQDNAIAGSVMATDDDSGDNGKLQYAILPPWNINFSVNQTGQIEVISSLDREELTSSPITLLVTAHDMGTPSLMSIAIVYVHVQDVNDHAPRFVDSVMNISIAAGQNVSLPIQAYDEDEDKNNYICYSIQNTNTSQSSLEIKNGRLRSTTSLAYGVYEVEVIAYNTVPYKPSTLKNDTLTVYIHVKDINSYSPKFDNLSYAFSIPEDFEVGNIVNQSTIHAQDADKTPKFNTVTYGITNGSGYFEIDPHNAALRLIKPLNYEIEPTIHFQVTASDGDSTHQVSVNVSVIVSDVNNHAPVFTSALYNCTVSENVNSPITCHSSINATDGDSGYNGRIRYSLDGQMKDIFAVNNISGVISPRSALDYDIGVRAYVLSILATDCGRPERTGSAVVEISVKDINDNPPVIRGPSQFTVPENSPVNTILGAIFATDADVDDNLVFSVSDTTNFYIKNETGVLMTGKKFDYEKTTDRLLHVNVTVSDGRHNIECCIAVSVTNVNDEVPVFVNSSLTPTISEDMDSPSFYIQATDGDVDAILFYNISFDSRIRISNSSGLVTIDGPVNSSKSDDIKFNVSVSDGIHLTTAAVRVHVTDINDNAPRFENSTYIFNVDEELDNATVGTVKASDDDIEPKNKYMFYMIPSLWSSNFTINPMSGAIRTNGALDRENPSVREDQLELIVMVMDKGLPPLTGTAMVVINIKDVNDHRPTFVQTFVSYTIPEGQCPSPLHNLMIIDEDEGVNQQTHFKIINGNSDFFINNNSLECRNRTVAAGIYNMTIEATNNKQVKGESSNSDMQTFFLHVQDVNDNDPIFDPDVYWVDLLENQTVGELVVTPGINATDADTSAKYNTVTYAVVKGNGSTYFDIDPNMGRLWLKTPLDYEQEQFLTLTISASDGHVNIHDKKVNSATASVNVRIHNVNDNKPMFTTGLTNCSVLENVTGEFNCVVKATDADNTGNLTYSLVSHSQIFDVDSNTGKIFVKNSTHLDYDHGVRHFDIQVLATDGGFPKFGGSTVVSIDVVNVNDEPPIFANQTYVFVIPEAEQIEYYIGQVSATDQDEDSYGILTYSLPNSKVMHIDNKTGDVFTSVVLDYENQRQRVLSNRVVAWDGTTSVTATVTVSVINVNDNTPQFNKSTYRTHVRENTVSGHLVTQVQAFDEDITDNLQYSIEGGNDKCGTFTVNITSGEIFVFNKTCLDYERQQEYILVVEVNDGGTPPRSNQTIIEVNVIDENDVAPTFLTETLFGTVKENVPVGTSILQIFAKDPDTPLENVTLSVNNSRFAFDKWTLCTNSSLNAEDIHSYKLDISVSDGVTDHIRSQLITVNISDINDNNPAFNSTSYDGVIRQNAKDGSYVLTVGATDRDISNTGFTFYMSGGEGNFVIDSHTGVVTTKVDEHVHLCVNCTYIIDVHVVDYGEPPKSNSTRMVIRIDTANYNAPIFNNTPYTVNVTEHTTFNDSIINVSATDADCVSPGLCGPAGSVEYSIISGSHGHFSINQSTGYIYVIGSLDYTEAKFYDLCVEARDQADDFKTTTATVHVDVIDVNERPHFVKNVTSVCSVEDVKAGDLVGIVTASDPDHNSPYMFDKLTYTLINDNDTFHVNATTGKVYASKNMTADFIQNVVLQFVVTDHGGKKDNTTLRLSTGTKGKPVFDQSSSYIHVQIQENTTVPVEVADVNTTTEASGNISYHLTHKGPHSQGFRINTATGVIEATKPLDRETAPNIILTVTAANSEGVCSSLVDIEVLDVNDQPPVFQASHASVSVPESTPVKTCIRNVSVIDKDINPQLTFMIRTDNITSFGIKNDNGSLSACVFIASSLDFEKVTNYNLRLQVDDGTFNDTMSLAVSVQDVNDNVPVFANRTYHTSIPEDTAVGSSFYQLRATDADHLDDGKLQYTLVNVSDNYGQFSVRSDKSIGYVILNRHLDREASTSYILEFHVTDTANHTDSTSLNITVLDVNDNQPVFQKAVYNVTVDEGPNSDLFTIETEAVDSDEGPNAELVYSIISQDFGHHFVINSTTGTIGVVTSLNREDTPVYTLVIQAADDGETRLSGTATVFVNVEDINDCIPEFLQTTYSAAVMEGSPSGTSVIHLTAVDNDVLPINKNVSYSVLDDSDLFGVDGDGVLTLKQKVVLGTHPTPYVIRVEATDGEYNTMVNVTITVIDVNDHDPVFNETFYLFSVPENDEFADPPSVFVGMVSASDADPGRNGEVSYSILSTDVPVFIISQRNGSIATNGTLDRDQCVSSRYTFTVIATDNGNAKRTGFVEVTVTITDVNDNRPNFTSSHYDGNIIENSVIGTEVNIHPAILANDIDAGDNGTDGIVFYLSTDSPFIINNRTGRIFVNHDTLDREKQDTYDLKVMAVDQSGSGKNNSASLIITLTDANDESPVFTNNISVFNINESVPSSYVVGMVHTSDADTDGNVTTRYDIDSGGDGRFYIDPIQGDIIVTGGLDREQKGNYTLSIRASDGLNYATAEVEIILEDANDNAPIFPSNPVVINVTESNANISGIYNFTAYDADIGNNAYLSFFINKSDSSTFTVSEDGILSTIKPIDRETNASYSFLVHVHDNGIPSLSSSVMVICQVLDSNDNFPTFYDSNGNETTEYRTFILEKSPIDSPVFFPYVRDKDLGLNSVVRFQLLGTEKDLFNCNANTGVVTIADRIEINSLLEGKGDNVTENYVDITLVVEASDEGYPSKSTNLTLHVTVEQISDENPVFDHTLYEFYIPESTSKGSCIGVVKALMPNVTNFHLTYSFVITTNILILEKDSGKITLNSTLDREESERHTFAVQVTDGKTPERTAFTMVNIYVTDVNDNPPHFDQLSYVFTVTEDTYSVFEIGNISATDRDTGRNAMIQYSLYNYTGDVFSIDNTTGGLVINGTLDRESNTDFTLIVQAEDEGLQPLNATAFVRVEILDVNDNSPKFQWTNYTCFVYENAPHKQICNISATDDDMGDNGTVVYALLENNIPFYINPIDGTIWKSGLTDFETKNTYNLTLEARDLGSPERSSSVSLVITIGDVPDTAPHFPRRTYNVYTSSFIPLHTVLLNETAGDGDITYTIADGLGDVLDIFCIDHMNGVLSLCKPMDPKQSTYVLTVQAEDANLTDMTVVVIHLRNEPASFNQSKFTADVKENHHVGLLLDLNATEELAGVPVHYTLISVQPEDSRFMVNTTTGQIYCVGTLDRERAKAYILEVSAEVVRNSRRTKRSFDDSLGKVTVTVRVGDENDNPPSFSVDMKHVYHVPASLKLASKVAELQAFDPDENSNITYHLVNSGELPFFLESDNTTRVLLKSPLAIGSYQLTVSAIDEGGLSSDVNITIGALFETPRHFTFTDRSGEEADSKWQEEMALGAASIITIPDDDRLTYVIPMSPQEFEKQGKELIANLSSLLGVNVTLEGYTMHISKEVEPSKTDLLLFATNRTTGRLLSSDELSSLISAKFADIFNLFKCTTATCYIQTVPVKHSVNVMTAPEIALLMIAVLIFVACVLVIIAGNHVWKQFHTAREQEEKMWELESFRSDGGSYVAGTTNPNQETSFANLDNGGDLSSGLATNTKRSVLYESQELTMNFDNEAFVLEPPVVNGADSGVENDSSSSSSNVDDNESARPEVYHDTSSLGKVDGTDHFDQGASGSSSVSAERMLSLPSQQQTILDRSQRVTLQIEMDTGATSDDDLNNDHKDTSSISSTDVSGQSMANSETSEQLLTVVPTENDQPVVTSNSDTTNLSTDTAPSGTSYNDPSITDENIEEEMTTSL